MRARFLAPFVASALAGAIGGWALSTFVPGEWFPGGKPVEQTSSSELEEKLRQFIQENPEVVADAARTLQERRRASAKDELAARISLRSDEIFDDSASPVGGNPTGDVTIVEFFDYNCPYCRKVVPTLIEIERSDPKLRFVYKEFPILGPGSLFAARAALASVRQGMYVEYHKAMMQSPGSITDDRAIEIAATVGLDVDRLKRDMEDPEIQAAIERNLELAATLGINGTPTFVAGTKMLVGAQPRKVIEDMIARARKQ